MKPKSNLKPVLVLMVLFACSQSFGQNLETMYIEKLEPTSYVFPAECNPEHMIIVINSSIPDLRFESNMILSEEMYIFHNETENQYIICHEKMKFKLTVSGPNLQSEDIDIFDIQKPLEFRITANIAKGIVNIITNPKNATVIFPELNNQVHSTNRPITNFSGKYRVNIVKPQYKNLDTVIIIPRDAEKTFNFELVPLFSRLKLDLRTDDSTTFQTPPIMWIDSTKLELDALVKPGMNQRSFFDDVEFNRFYDGNIIPVTEGIHKIKIQADGYIPYEKTIEVKSGKLYNLPVRLESIFGYLTFVDKQFAEGATVYVNGQKIGQVPLFKVKTKIGVHKVKFEKSGYVPMSEENEVVVEEKKVTDFDVSMFVARKVSFETNPPYAEIVMDNNRIGFSPVSTIINEGTHEILVRKSGFATEKITKIINNTSPDNEVQKIDLKAIYPLSIESEKKGLEIKITGKDQNQNIVFDEKYLTPATIPLPYGKYLLTLTDGKKKYYNGIINHKEEIIRRGKLPNYSRTSFHLLEASMEINQHQGKFYNTTHVNDIDNFEVSVGRIHVFPRTGLSSAIFNFDYNCYRTDSMNYKTIAPYFFFLNWDWRLGGSVLRQLDVNLLGRAKYTPGLKFTNIYIPGLTDVEMQNYFYGFEISSRLSYINLNFRFGRQINIGKMNMWNEEGQTYMSESIDLSKTDKWVGSIGLTLNGKVYKSNNMLRLWNNPLIDPMKRKSEKTPTEKSDESFLNKLKFWE
jgi:hypothetical protein